MESPTGRFAYRLCLALGYPTPRHLLRCITSKELAEWMAYFRIEPFGQDQSDYIMAQMAAILYGANSGKNQKKLDPEDFGLYKKLEPMQDVSVWFEQMKRTYG